MKFEGSVELRRFLLVLRQSTPVENFVFLRQWHEKGQDAHRTYFMLQFRWLGVQETNHHWGFEVSAIEKIIKQHRILQLITKLNNSSL